MKTTTINPYKDVDWNNVNHIPSSTHMHLDTEEHFWHAYSHGIRHFAVGNYGVHWNPHDYVANVPSDVIVSPNTELHGGFSPFYVGITGTGSMYSDPTNQHHGMDRFDYVDILYSQLKYDDIGVFVITHPLRSTDPEPPHTAESFVSNMIEMLDYNPLIQLEIYNGSTDPDFGRTDRKGAWADKLWDLVLATGRQCYGHFNPDHIVKWVSGDWRGRNILLTDNKTEEDCLLSYKNGSFYGAMLDSDLKFTNIALDEFNRTLSIETTNADEITFITNKGRTVINGNKATFSYFDEVFIRVEAKHNDNNPISFVEENHDIIFSQPIILGQGAFRLEEALLLL